jgi:hypothetical protein
LQAHLDQFFAVQVIKNFFRERARQVHPVSHRVGGWFG